MISLFLILILSLSCGEKDKSSLDSCSGEQEMWCRDSDGDGFSDGSLCYIISDCDPLENYVQESGDCDDNDPLQYPGAEEVCNGSDDDCDRIIPEDERDFDLDGFVECFDWSGWGGVRGGDCDDYNSNINPSSYDIPGDGIDSDCDGLDD